ncbi:hypothetical protein [Pseudomonas rubra]|uniref:Uncharacterized protein n=1 Tax=Pseudomonas rubra TaxID=2942627 RepID=A0ABT5P9Q6_9PSED|nr:hypothetical protein [Pseudomonas rubra]MDD1015031.1 hypothetical protein [Pseudomonas rubra]MDD1038634.1 hypothetical protein [Pseudomonas rubra]MDD1154674.1 hypothetical protein [Pseudomonas rubra]
MATLTVRDESVSGEVFDDFALHFATDTITVRQLIRERVHQEVLQRSSDTAPHSRRQRLVSPEPLEAALNGERPSERPTIDWRKQVEVAYDAFVRNGFFILLDERQAESLDEVLTIRHDSVVNFIKLAPLVGG